MLLLYAGFRFRALDLRACGLVSGYRLLSLKVVALGVV